METPSAIMLGPSTHVKSSFGPILGLLKTSSGGRNFHLIDTYGCVLQYICMICRFPSLSNH